MTTGKVKGIIANLVTVVVDGPVSQNEICYIKLGETRLMAEVIKVIGDNVYVQVFESTRGLKVGDTVEFTGHMLEVTLGPGLLSRNYDGLQNDLDKLTGVFLQRGEYNFPLDEEKLWKFEPIAKVGDKVEAAAWLGEVDENYQPHKIMVPFVFEGTYTVKSIVAAGEYKINDTIAVLTDAEGNDHNVTMVQKWPVKKPVLAYKSKPRPFKLLETGVRTIDTANPICEGGTGFIPGPFGTGKTVLQHAISKQAEADIVIIAACGERANEVVETFTEFPELEDPHTGRKLMERTIIIANTSNMPVASREASVYTSMAIAEYYRSMGLRVLLMADSTSRWAQALREMSNRLEELPGQDAFPMDLSAIIGAFYARAGYVYLNNGATGSVDLGSITLDISGLGTVSSADYVLPLPHNYDVILGKNTKTNVLHDVAFLPGSTLHISEGAEVNLGASSKANVYVYDKKYSTINGTGYCGALNKEFYTIKTRPDGIKYVRNSASIQDAKFVVVGDADMVKPMPCTDNLMNVISEFRSACDSAPGSAIAQFPFSSQRTVHRV